MSKYSFSYIQRYAVYKAFDGICQWCKEPVDFRSYHVDHVIPEEILSDSNKHATILASYGLPSDFNINNYENWIPSHSSCNQGKSDKVYSALGIIKTILDSCANKKELEQRIEIQLIREPKKAKLLANIQAAIDINLVNLDELQTFFLKTDIMDSEDEDLKKINEKLDQKLEYQTAKMIAGIISIVKPQTIDVLNSLVASLGKNWRKWNSFIIWDKMRDNPNATRAGIVNKVDESLAVKITVNPAIIDKKLVITFREETGEDHEVFDTYIQDLQKGINWGEYREILREHYKDRLKKLSI